jgi:predicted RNase H-like HicB family nuclease
MKKQFTATVWQEDKWFVARCNEFEIASQGKSTEEALSNLQEAIELHFEQPTATVFPKVYKLEAEVNASV